MTVASNSLTVEVCVDSVESAITAAKAGADRLEVCANLGAGGGTTATLGLVKSIQKAVDLPLMVGNNSRRCLFELAELRATFFAKVMIRPRVGDFLYSKDEIEVMLEDIRTIKNILGGVRGFVIGALTKDGRVDAEVTKTLVDEILPLEVCFHRAFDMTRDPMEAISDIVDIGGIARILTSGQSRKAPQALPVLTELFKHKDRLVEDDVWGLTIMPGSGINRSTLPSVLKALLPAGLREIHLSGGNWVLGGMQFKRTDMGMGVESDTEWGVWRAQEDDVREVREISDIMWREFIAAK